MKYRLRLVLAAGSIAVLGLAPLAALAASAPLETLSARVVAEGIPDAGAISAVGVFHAGGPFHDIPAFVAFTQDGRVLDPARILVATSSNFGSAPLGTRAPGAILSLDPRGPEPLRVPPAFAASGGQTVAMGGRVQLLTAAGPGFVNGLNTPSAATADLPSVGNPRAISINNGFGRLWFANAPPGAPGFETIVDPTGIPLANAPDKKSGGAFRGSETNRAPEQRIPGAVGSATVATALLGMSPDGSKRAVFAVLNADGSVVQAHTEVGVDGLAPPGTVGAVDPATTRTGMLFNWVPDRKLFVADPKANAIVVLALSDDGKAFTMTGSRRLASPALHQPVDLAPSTAETVNPIFSSNTTLAANADFYVVNRGDGTIVRMRQDGTVAAVRRVAMPGAGALGAGRLNGIAVASDARHLWLTVSGPGASSGMVIEVPAFGGPAFGARAPGAPAAGAAIFARTFTPANGLGPLFNERSCAACHAQPSAGGMGPAGLSVVAHVGFLDHGRYDGLLARGGPVARAHSVAELGGACPLQPGVPAAANLISIRNTPALYDTGALAALPDGAIAPTLYPDGVHGRPNRVFTAAGERIGRFGWKGATPDLAQLVGNAFRDEMGVTNPLAPHDLVVSPASSAARCPGESDGPKIDQTTVAAVTAFIASLTPPPAPAQPAALVARGEAVFAGIGCAECHAALRAPGSAEPLYSDVLLHDMGPALDDGIPEASAGGADWRTTPLMGLASRQRFLHDGRAENLAAAVTAHGGEAESAVVRYRSLGVADNAALTAFLESL